MATLPAVTADQMREVDRMMIDEFRIDLTQMMENAGRNLADLAQQLFAPSDAVVLAGPGGNGGGGLVAARHLANRGVAVQVVLGKTSGRNSPTTVSWTSFARCSSLLLPSRAFRVPA